MIVIFANAEQLPTAVARIVNEAFAPADTRSQWHQIEFGDGCDYRRTQDRIRDLFAGLPNLR